MTSYREDGIQEDVKKALDNLGGAAWEDGADYEHDHNTILKGVLRWDFDRTGQLQFWTGSAWKDIVTGPPAIPTEAADTHKLWLDGDPDAT